MQRGYLVLIPFSEHAPFDLVAYQGHEFLRIQVKYRSAAKGVLTIPFRTSWAAGTAVTIGRLTKTKLIYSASIAPKQTSATTFNPQEYRRGISLRIAAPKNNQAKNVRMAEEFRQIP